MTTLLRIDASSRSEGSFSRDLGDHFEKTWLGLRPGGTIIRRDLAASPIEHIRHETIGGFYTPAGEMTPALTAATALSDRLIAELRAADTILITTPMYNFSVPSALKAWIDQIMRIGHTFSYDGQSFAGLVTGKKAYVLVAYGAGGYVNGGPFSGADFVQPYLTFLLNFMGITDVTFIPIEATTAEAARTDRSGFEARALGAISDALAMAA